MVDRVGETITTLAEIEPDSVKIDPRPCELCGCTTEDVEELIYLRADDLIAQWERADPRDCWRYIGEQPPRAVERAPAAAQPYRTPQSTIDAFWYVAGLNDPDHLKRSLAEHPRDVMALQKLWEAKHARS
jgi:hypothetical protein